MPRLSAGPPARPMQCSAVKGALRTLGAVEGDTLKLLPTGRTEAGELKADLTLVEGPRRQQAPQAPAGVGGALPPAASPVAGPAFGSWPETPALKRPSPEGGGTGMGGHRMEKQRQWAEAAPWTGLQQSGQGGGSPAWARHAQQAPPPPPLPPLQQQQPWGGEGAWAAGPGARAGPAAAPAADLPSEQQMHVVESVDLDDVVGLLSALSTVIQWADLRVELRAVSHTPSGGCALQSARIHVAHGCMRRFSTWLPFYSFEWEPPDALTLSGQCCSNGFFLLRRWWWTSFARQRRAATVPCWRDCGGGCGAP